MNRIRMFTSLLVNVAVAASALEFNFGTAPTGDGGRGFGILAEYGEGGPKTLTITRTTLPGCPKPDYWKKWGNICSLHVYDPDGFESAYLEMGDQTAETQTYTLKIPEGAAGLWRVSVSGGFCPSGRYQGDTFKVIVPDSNTWGIRGEKGLRLFGDNLPPKFYMAFAPTSDLFYLTGDNLDWTIDGKPIEGETGSSQSGKDAVLAHRPAGAEILELTLKPSVTSFRLFVDGLPSTLSPTPEMARRIMGGAMQADNGDWCEGPLQAKCRNEMLKLAGQDMDVSEFADKLSGDWTWRFVTNQVLDVKSPYYGQSFTPQFAPNNGDFFHYSANFYNPGSFADLASNSPAFLRRAILSGFCAISAMDAAGIHCARKSDTRPLNGARIDVATGFDVCVGIARGYARLKPYLTPELEKLYREGVMQIIMKQQGFMSYQSNQWMHILEAYNELFCTTGDMRLERCLRVQLKSFIRNDFRAKHGQHPAGYYSEENGPDGNYDQMSLRPMSVIYSTYREQPGADAELIDMMQESIAKNLRYRSIFAVPDPATTNGTPYQLAYAQNHRTDGPTHFDSHGGLAICSNEFPMAYTLASFGKSYCDSRRCLKLPYELQGVSFEKPGFMAMRRGDLYGVHYWKTYDTGADGFLGPLFIWHEKAGMGLCGIKHSYGQRHAHWFGNAMETNDITFATVYGDIDGKLYVPSRRMKKSFTWNERGKSYTITGRDEKLGGSISWTTDFVDDNVIEFTISVDFAALKDATVNLPILRQRGRTVWSHEGWRDSELDSARGRYFQRAPSGELEITWPTEIESQLVRETPCTRGWCENLRLKVPASGKLKIRYEAK